MIIVKASTKDELLKAKNNNPNQKVYGITSSGNIYFIEQDENITQCTPAEISKVNNIDIDVINNAINKVINDGDNYVEINNEAVQKETTTNNEQVDNKETTKPEEVSIEELANNLNDIVDNLQTNNDNDRLEQLEKRVVQLEQTITTLKEQVINDIRIRLTR